MTSTASTTDRKPFVGLIRISDLGSREKGNNLSAEDQVKAIDAIAAKHGFEIGWWVSEEDISGVTLDRVGWSEVLGLIRSGQAGGVALLNQARMSRARAHRTSAEVEEVESLGGEIFSQAGQITVATLEGELMTFVNGWKDHAEWKDKTDGLKKSVVNAIDRGAHLQAGFGFCKTERIASRAQPLEPDPVEAPVVKLMCELRAGINGAAGLSWKAIARELDRRGHKPRPFVRNGELVQGRWRHQAVRDIVTSETIIGVAWNGDYRRSGAHPALVSQELWAAANATRKPKPVGPSGGFALSGLVRCSGCGRVMSHSGSSFRCQDQGATPCPGRVTVPAGPLTEWVTDIFKSNYLGTTFGAKEADAMVAAAKAAVEGAAAAHEVACARELKAAASGSVRALETASANVTLTEQALVEAEQGLADARAAARGVSLPDWLDADAFDDLPPDEQNRWLEAVFAFVVVRRDPVWRGPIEDRATLVRAVDVIGDPIAAAVNR